MNRFHSFLFIAALALTGCSGSGNLAATDAATTPDYTITYIIHGDATYLYHNADGIALQADKQVLAEAKTVAQQAAKGEVFIFHQKPESKFLWIFPKKDRELLYYRNGQLVDKIKYSPSSEISAFAAESELFNEIRGGRDASSRKNIMLYFGHEVPQDTLGSYNYSRPSATLGTESFGTGIRSFLSGDEGFDLTVLSTCNNGTPAMIHELSPVSKYILASPQNLHLSHIDTRALEMLDEPEGVSTETIADRMAESTYERLSSFLQTVVTLVRYDTDEVESYLPALYNGYKAHLDNQSEPVTARDNVDCATLSFFEKDQYSDGIRVWYKAPQFGSKGKTDSYSGWGCKQ